MAQTSKGPGRGPDNLGLLDRGGVQFPKGNNMVHNYARMRIALRMYRRWTRTAPLTAPLSWLGPRPGPSFSRVQRSGFN